MVSKQAGEKPRARKKQMGKKAGKQIGTGRRRRLTAASQAAVPFLDRALRRQGLVQRDVLARWADIVGDELAAHALPLSIRFPAGRRSSGVLTVGCESAYAPLLQMRVPIIREAVNSFFGYGAVSDVKLRHMRVSAPRRQLSTREFREITDAEARAIEGAIGARDNRSGRIEDSELAATLRRLGEMVYADHNDNGED